MIQEDKPQPPAGEGEEPSGGPPARPPGTNLAAVAGAIVLILLLGLALYRRHHPRTAPGEESGEVPAESTPSKGTPITAVLPYRLSPEASIIAERYRCVCGCMELLNVCTCTKTPGSHDIKKHLQGLVDQKKSVQDIDSGMIAKFGPGVLLTNPVPSPSLGPSASRGSRGGAPPPSPKAAATPRRAARPNPPTGSRP
jgi:hypothetical protein